MADRDLSSLTDEELEYVISNDGQLPKHLTEQASPGMGAQQLAERNALVEKKAAYQTPAQEDYTLGMSGPARFAAGFGANITEPFIGAKEKLQLAFPGEGDAGKAELARIAAEREQRRGHIANLMKTPAGQAGAFAGEAIPAAVVGASVPAQMALAGGRGFLAGGSDKPTGIGGELATSGVKGLIEAGTAGALTKGLNYAGKIGGAALGRTTPEGATALELDAAARRMGLPPLSVGQLDPASAAATIERGLSGYPASVKAQADALAERMALTRQVPAAVGSGTEAQVIPGGALMKDMSEAAKKVMSQGSEKYKAVDQWVADQGLTGVAPQETYNALKSIQTKLTPKGGTPLDNPAFNLIDNYNPQAMDWIRNGIKSGQSVQQIVQNGIPLSAYHEMRVAAGKALNSLMRAPSHQLTAEMSTTRRELADLIKSLDADAEKWALKNKDNKEAMDLYNNAKEYYAKVVAPTAIENPVARKLTTRRNPYQSADQLYSELLAPTKQEFVDRLLPTMTPEGRDALNLFRNVPELGRAVLNREAPKVSEKGGLSSLWAAARNPATAAGEMTPGLAWLGKTRPGKRLYFAEDTLRPGTLAGGLATGTAQYPQGEMSSAVQRKLNLR